MNEIQNDDEVMDPAGSAIAVPETAALFRQPLTMSDFEDRIRRYNSDLDHDTLPYQAAVVLLAGCEFGHNIDRITRRTGYPRPLVAQVARRLIDNGVWKAGVTVADWTSSEKAPASFWNDVAVAEGRMCRRIGPNGQIEWAPAGFWNKSFQFVDPEADKSLSTLYHNAGPEDKAEPETVAEPEPSTDPELPALIGLPLPRPADLDQSVDTNTSAAGSNGAGSGGAGVDDAGSNGAASNDANGNGRIDETEIIGPATGKPISLPAAASGDSAVPPLDDLFSNVVWIG